MVCHVVVWVQHLSWIQTTCPVCKLPEDEVSKYVPGRNTQYFVERFPDLPHYCYLVDFPEILLRQDLCTSYSSTMLLQIICNLELCMQALKLQRRVCTLWKKTFFLCLMCIIVFGKTKHKDGSQSSVVQQPAERKSRATDCKKIKPGA